jgi:chromosomal replication initiator protein
LKWRKYLVRARTAQEIWDTALGELQLQVSKANFRTWLEKTKGLSYQDNQLLLGVPNTFVAEYLDKNLRSLIEKTLIGIVQSEVKVSFTVDSKSSAFEAKPAMQVNPMPTLPALVPANLTRLNPKYTFDTFVVSHCNRLAYTASLSAAERPGLSSYNPLYIYGGVGLGKTHLLNSIGNAALTKGIRVLYVNAEQFTNEFINAIREHKTGDFRSKYRSAEMLLIDDIQFIGGKEQTEESFFHIFNELRDADRQIALTSNCPPHSMPLIQERLRSRLEWGLSTGIQAPDFATRLAILAVKAKKEGVELSPDVLEFIAERIKQNIRELEGSLNRVIAYSRLLQAVVTPELANEALEDLATKKPKAPPSTTLLLETVATYFDLDVLDLRGSKRDKQAALARQIAMYMLREQGDLSLSTIGRELGGRQPITVSQAHKKISEGLAHNPDIKQIVTDIQQKLSPK